MQNLSKLNLGFGYTRTNAQIWLGQDMRAKISLCVLFLTLFMGLCVRLQAVGREHVSKDACSAPARSFYPECEVRTLL